MNSIYKVFNNLNKFYTEINPATLTGAIDVVVVEQEDGTLQCSPFHVRFGKLGVLRSREKVVDIEVNGEPVEIHMKLGDSGEAFFVEEIAEDDETQVPDNLATSPIPTNQFMYDEDNSDYRAINAALIDELEPAMPRPRRNSIDMGENPQIGLECTANDNIMSGEVIAVATAATERPKYENQTSSFAHRRYTTDSVQRNDMSNEKLKLTKQKIQQDWAGPCTDDKNDGVDGGAITNEVVEAAAAAAIPVVDAGKGATPPPDPAANDDAKEDSKSKKKRRKKSIMKKKNSLRKNSSSSSAGSAASEVILLSRDTDSASSSQQQTPVASTSDAAATLPAGSSEVFKPIEPAAETRIRDLDVHFFSDTEVDTGVNRNNSRPSTPVLSDTEFEMNQRSNQSDVSQASTPPASWKWGELPTPNGESGGDQKVGGQRRSMLTAMFSFMQQNRKSEGGLYLSDLDAEGMDPEVAALYFPEQRVGKEGRRAKDVSSVEDDDRESGNGTSLPHSPSSVELGSKTLVDSDLDDSRERHLDFIALSTCGGLEVGEPTHEEFNKHLVTYSEACRNPSIFASPNLVVRLNNKYYTWAAACPIVMTMITFRKPLPQEAVEQLVNNANEENSLKIPNISSSQPEGRGFSWFWRRSTDKNNTSSDKSFGKEALDGPMDPSEVETMAKDDAIEAADMVPPAAGHSIEDAAAASSKETVVPTVAASLSVKAKEGGGKDKFKKSLRLSSDQIEALNLRNGTNEVQFSVTTAYQGTSRCTCYIFLWRYNDKIVISDVDGTITKSDVLGHLMPLVGRDWAQLGVAELYSKIEENGYKILYLSARAIGQSRTTREYLRSIRQGDVNLPDGPLLLNPTSLLSAFHREVIEKKPELFKIACLNDIKMLFPANPFYAGYGNRVNDVWAYRAVGIPIERIFTINTKGELRHELTQTFQSSYCSMAFIADHLFPPIGDEEQDCTNDEYSSFNFWRDPVAEIPLGEELAVEGITTAVAAATPNRTSDPPKAAIAGTSAQLTTIPEK